MMVLLTMNGEPGPIWRPYLTEFPLPPLMIFPVMVGDELYTRMPWE